VSTTGVFRAEKERSMSQVNVAYDPFAPGFAENPYPQYQALRDADPVHHSPLGVWLLLGYDDVLGFLRDPRLSVEDRHAGPTVLSELTREVLGDDEPGNETMLMRDPPDHTRLRRLVSKAFTPRTIEQLADRIQALINEHLGEWAGNKEVDVIESLAFPLPFRVISELLGMPDTDTDQLREWSGLLVRTLEPVADPDTLRAIATAGVAMHDLVSDVITWKRAHPGNDLLSALIAAEEHGDVLSDTELADQVALLYIAGHETTVNLIGNGTLALLKDDDQRRHLQADPALSGNAVEELLRYDPPVQMTRRITLHDTMVGETEIEAGSFVVLVLASANRDARRWGATAPRLDVTRADANQHVSFGGGVHYCLGAALARLEAKLAIATLLHRYPGLLLADTPQWNGRINLRGLAELRVTLNRRRDATRASG
jgi:cytochrome P450